MEKLQNYINGQLLAPQNGNYIDNFHPATGKVYSLIPDSDTKDVQSAVEAAKAAFPSWSVLPVEKRAKFMLKIASIIERDMDLYVKAESRDNGKSVHTAGIVDIPRAISNLEFFATGIMHFAAESHITEDTAVNYTMRMPIGVVGCISCVSVLSELLLQANKINAEMAAVSTARGCLFIKRTFKS
jgi:aminomuconate-semialdehyde/2-hydroxymuconate-6-semialdehyde dehydrogenase